MVESNVVCKLYAMKRSKRYLILLTVILALSTCKKSNNPSNNLKSLKTISTSESSVQIVGAMRNVMWKGQLGGVVQLDTLAKNRKGLYGLGPVEYLQGEILIYDGTTLVSTVNDEGNPVVKEIPQVSAPFFVYGHQDRWNSLELPETVHDIPSLEQFITSKTDHLTKPFVFKINATVEKAIYHIQDLPQGSIVRNPEEAPDRRNSL